MMINKMVMEAAEANTGAPPAAPAAPAKKAREVETVTMEDGRVVEFVGKRKMLKESFVQGLPDQTTGPTVRLDFRNGKTLVFEIPSEDTVQYACHGAEQKLGDETAGEEDVDDMYLAVEELMGRLYKHEWTIAREGGGMSGTSVLLKALMEFSGNTIEKVKEFLKGKSQKEKTALRQSPKIKPIVDRIEAEKAAKASSVDTDALLGQLGGQS